MYFGTRHLTFRNITDVNALGDFQTEGELTFEDGMISCSALQIGMMGVIEQDAVARKYYTDAMLKILNKPLVCSALLSTALLHFEGRVSSNAPKKEAANTISIKQKNMLKIAFVESAFKALAPNIKVMARPNNT
jgi:hypothetical protein